MNPFLRSGHDRLLSLLMAMALTVLAACGGGGDSSTPAPPNAVPVSITAQPTEQSVVTGDTATFTIAAVGDGLSYQWQTSADAGVTWTDILGAIAASVTVPATDPALNGSQYRVIVSGAGSPVTSSAVTLTVAPAAPAPTAPVISVDVTATTVTEGGDAVFAVTATGTSLTYQWQASADGTSFADVAGATDATLRLAAVALVDSGKSVRVVVSSGTLQTTSSAVVLTVTPAVAAAAITAQPVDVSVTAPSQASFTVVATGSPAPAYQWQKSTDNGTTYANVDGATATSYTTPATAVSDSDSLFRVSVSNTGATVVSDPARLTVAATPVPASIVTQPVSATVIVPSSATFTVVASGTPTPTYQWQLSTDGGATFANITGATTTSYTTPATVLADNGKQHRVVVTNGSGSVPSGVAVLTVNAAASPLAGRAWTTGQSLETDDNNVQSLQTGIDDDGNAIVVFLKSNGTRNVLYATRMVPGAAGIAPVWSAHVAIDTVAISGGASTTSTRVLTVAPNGNAAVTWAASAPCTASTYSTNVNSSCNYLYVARYTAASNAWDAPVQLADTPDSTPGLQQRLDSNGDLAILYPGWERSGTSSYTARPAVLWQAAGQASVQKRVFNDAKLNALELGMDRFGNMVLAAEAEQDSTADIVAYRGAVAVGFGAQEVLDTRSAAANYEHLAVGLNGQVIVVWNQNNGAAVTRFTADLNTPTGVWRVSEMEPYANTGNFSVNALRVNEAGEGLYAEYSNGACTSYFHRFVGGVWSALLRFPSGFPDCAVSSVSLNRNGDALIFESSGWTTYDAATNSVIRLNTSSAPSVYGTSGGSLGTSDAGLSISGIAVLATAVNYDTLPTPATPAGDGRSAVINLWGLVLK